MNANLKFIVFVLCMIITLSTGAQIRLEGYHSKDINPELYRKNWDARWISLPNEPSNIYGIYHFRKSFELDSVPDKFIIHVSADNRYKLFVNG